MKRGTVVLVNNALSRPVLLAGVEKRLALLNACLCFPLVALTHVQFPACLLGVGLFVVIHALLIRVSRWDPLIGQLFQRSQRYSVRAYFPPVSHPSVLPTYPVRSVARVY